VLHGVSGLGLLLGLLLPLLADLQLCVLQLLGVERLPLRQQLLPLLL